MKNIKINDKSNYRRFKLRDGRVIKVHKNELINLKDLNLIMLSMR